MPLIFLTVLTLAILVLLVVVSRQPSTFTLTRSTLVAAPAEAVFPLVNDFHKWQVWSPWLKLDPAVRTTYDGPPTGVGAKYAWAGNKKIGEGRIAITESRPPELVRIDMEFLKPWKAQNTGEFTFKPENGQTRVNWSMSGTNGFMQKAMHLVIDFDKLVGRDFEEGLAKMKAATEALPKG